MTQTVAHPRPHALPVRVVDLAELLLAATWVDDEPVAVVVDATRPTELPVTVLARLVQLRRAVRAMGGELVLAARQPVAQLLRRTGLLFAIPCHDSVEAAVGSVDAAA